MHTSPKPAGWTTASTLLALGFLTSVWAWWVIAPDVATFSSAGMEKHGGHFGLVYFHVVGGTIMLFLGLANLYIGTSNKFFQYHRLVGRLYLLGGTLGAISAIVITSSTAHKSAETSVFTNVTISLLTLAIAWLLAAGMAFRAVRNGRYDSHRDWMIRSYVLVWSFVFCRLVTRVPGVEEIGGGNASIWLSWVGPLIICEVALQWSAGSKKSSSEEIPRTGLI
jgi:uncharacterized membrane protein YozB (DUF420 family)